MKKYIIISALFLITCFSLYSQSINKQTVIKAAENYVSHFKNQPVFVKDVYTYSYAGTKDKHGLYLANFNTGGYLVMPNSKNVRPVLMVGESGSMHPDSLIPPVKMFLNWYSAQVEAMMDQNLTNARAVQKWDSVLLGKFTKSRETKSVTNPLLDQKEISWSQGDNPFAPDSCGQKSVSGCVATAMGQIMKYWEHPVSGEGTRSYSFSLENGCGDPTNISLLESFDEIAFIWELIPASPTGSRYEYEQMLEYYAGVGAKMDYSHSSSAGYSSDARYALVNYFRYNASTLKEKDGYGGNWKQDLRSSLDAGRPVYYRGEGNPSKGSKGKDAHAFVCDGYGYGGDDDRFHFNFGWGSYATNNTLWTTLDDITPDDDNYTLDQMAIFNIYPDCNFTVPSYTYVNTNVTIDEDEAKGWQADHIKVGDGYIFHIKNGGYCQMVAQEKIELKPGFHAKAGSYFQISFDYEYCGSK